LSCLFLVSFHECFCLSFFLHPLRYGYATRRFGVSLGALVRVRLQPKWVAHALSHCAPDCATHCFDTPTGCHRCTPDEGKTKALRYGEMPYLSHEKACNQCAVLSCVGRRQWMERDLPEWYPPLGGTTVGRSTNRWLRRGEATTGVVGTSRWYREL